MGTALTRKRTPLGPYRRPLPWVLRGSKEGGRFLMGEVPLYSMVVTERDVNAPPRQVVHRGHVRLHLQ